MGTAEKRVPFFIQSIIFVVITVNNAYLRFCFNGYVNIKALLAILS